MNFVGVDLAWGSRAASGLALIDAAGALVTVATAVTDEEIVERVQPWTGPPCVVAFDAPLVVVNPCGQRPCERLVNHYFGRFHAGCHPSNLGLPAFSDGGRARRLAARLGLEVDPAAEADRYAIEVYPHPAIVMLFELETVLRYKNKLGRTQPSLRSELLRLMSLMDDQLAAVVAGSHHWRALRDEVERATTKAQLKRAEDRVDAVVCAYIAWYARSAPGSVRVLGDARNGSILTPVTPAMGRLIDAGDDAPR